MFWKYFAAISGIVCVALPATAAAWIWFTFHDHRATVVRLQQEQARAAADKIGEFLRLIEAQLGWTALLPWNAVTEDERRLDALRLLRQVPAITELALLDDKGREQLRMSRLVVDAVGSGVDRSNEPLFQAARERSVFRGPVYFNRGSEPHMTISVSGARTGSGVSSATVNLKLIWDIVSRLKVGEGGRAYVVDATGRLIAHPDQGLVLRNTYLNGLKQVAEALDDTHSPNSVGGDVDSRGTAVLSAHAKVADLGWIVFVEVPIAEAYAPIYASLLATGVILFAGLALALASSLFLARRMVAPIQALEVGAGRIGAGSLDHRIDVSTGDELQSLGESFNEMAMRLQHSYATLERKVVERTHQLEQANLAKSRFLAAASHDLRQPLHALGLFADQLKSANTADERAAIEARIQTAVAAMDDLFGALLDISKLDAGVLVPSMESFPILHILRRLESTFANAARSKGLTLRIVDNSLWVHSDPILLERILNNLVSNAVRYTRTGGVVVGCRRRGRSVRIEVWDSGIGIPADQRQLVFSEFYRVGGSGHDAGLGLGLAIVDRLAKLLEHPLDLHSRVEEGTCFALSVQMSSPQPRVVHDTTTSSGLITDQLRGKLIAVLDDDQLVLEGMRGLLQSWGCCVVIGATLADVQCGLAGFKQEPDAIVTDFHLSEGLTGPDVVETLRNRLKSAVPALLISGDTDPERLKRAQATGYILLHKPLQPMALRAALSGLLKTRSASLETAQ